MTGVNQPFQKHGETTYQWKNYDPWTFFSSVQVLFLHESAQTLLHDFPIIGEISFCKGRAAEKCAAQWITVHNIRPVYTAKKYFHHDVIKFKSVQQCCTAEVVTHRVHTHTVGKQHTVLQTWLNIENKVNSYNVVQNQTAQGGLQKFIECTVNNTRCVYGEADSWETNKSVAAVGWGRAWSWALHCIHL